jgi:hypothetical protein
MILTGPLGLIRDPPKISIKVSGSDLFSHSVTRAVSSALKCFTSVFEMGTGGSATLEPPET